MNIIRYIMTIVLQLLVIIKRLASVLLVITSEFSLLGYSLWLFKVGCLAILDCSSLLFEQLL